MRTSLGIRVTPDERRRIHAAAFVQEISASAFVHKVVMAAVKKIERPSNKSADPVDLVLVGVRNGGPGYKRRGSKFVQWLKNRDRSEFRDLGWVLKGVDKEILRREQFKTVFAWCRKHFPTLLDRIPSRRQGLFAEGIWAGFTSS
jgi:hypothetical protein